MLSPETLATAKQEALTLAIELAALYESLTDAGRDARRTSAHQPDSPMRSSNVGALVAH